MRSPCIDTLLAILLAVLAAEASGEGFGERSRGHRVSKFSPATPAPSDDCPSSSMDLPASCPATGEGWIVWRDKAIRELVKPETPTKADCRLGKCRKYLDSVRVMVRSTVIADAIDACTPQGAATPSPALENLAAFVRTQRNADYCRKDQKDLTNQFGHGPSDQEYLKRARVALELPCLLKTPRFLKLISSPKTYRDAFDLIIGQNAGRNEEGCNADGQTWTVLPYKSRFLGTPDEANSYGRFFVLVPGADYDRWIQFGIWPPEDRARYKEKIKNVSIVAVSKAKDPRSENRFDALVDWWRVEDPNSGELSLKYKIDVPPDGEPASTPGVTGNCQECHKTIPIGIHPERTYEFKGRTLRQTRGNDRMKIPKQLSAYVFENYRRRPVYEIGADDTFSLPQNYGPVLGPDSEWTGTERTPESLRKCTSPYHLNAGSVKRVIEHMNCAACHSGRSGKNEGKKIFGALNFPRATETRRVPEPDLRRDLIRSHIETGVMPLDYASGRAVQMSRSERAALYDCLSQEYYQPNTLSGLFVDWLEMKIDGTGRPTASGVPVTMPAKAAGKADVPKWAMSSDVSASGYDERCLKCHPKVAGAKADGPSLFGIFSRQAATVQNFSYSADLSEAGTKGLVWDEASLMDYLKDPDQFLTDRLGRQATSDMLKRYPDEAVRRAIVKYLMTLK